MRVLLTNNLNRWLEGCDQVDIESYPLLNFVDKFSENIHTSRLLSDACLSLGTSAAIVEYKIKRKLPVLVSVKDARLVCVSLPSGNNELEEHYYYCNNNGEWLTENPFLAQFQYWFSNVEKRGKGDCDYFADVSFPVKEIAINGPTNSAIFVGGRMNWTHWNIDCLAPMLLLSPSEDEYLLTSKLNAWQLDSIQFFGYSQIPRLQISHGNGVSTFQISKLRFVWDFDQIDRIHFLRSSIAERRTSFVSSIDSSFLVSDFDQNMRVRRIQNPEELKLTVSRYSPSIINSSCLTYAQKVSAYMGAKHILALSGSDSINPVLFANNNSQIIQMVPWPNNLMLRNKYSMIVAFRQLAYQASLNTVPFFGQPVDINNIAFDSIFYYSPLELNDLLLSLDC